MVMKCFESENLKFLFKQMIQCVKMKYFPLN